MLVDLTCIFYVHSDIEKYSQLTGSLMLWDTDGMHKRRKYIEYNALHIFYDIYGNQVLG